MTINTLKCLFFFFKSNCIWLNISAAAKKWFPSFSTLVFSRTLRPFLGVPPSEYLWEQWRVSYYRIFHFKQPFCLISLASMLWWDCSEAAAGHFVFEVLADRHDTDAHRRGDQQLQWVNYITTEEWTHVKCTYIYILCSKLRDIKALSTVEQNFLAS